ncbi:MAG: hydrogenase formation protein HypD [Calditrichaeota bacterium]|nr:MAG: hydrogenase formation protein HypD [Calditrichota bacterium]
MKYVDEYRDPRLARELVRYIRRRSTRPWPVMEICGGQTHTLIRYGIDQLLEGAVTLIHGPGCPVCVTPLEKIDRALAIARRQEVIFTTFGDMMRVPGSETDLLSAKARGADVRMVYSPLDALELARKHPERQVVFFAVGFETTAPANAMAVWMAHQEGVKNFSVLVSHVLVPPAIQALMEDPETEIKGFIAPGHVCTVMGYQEYETLAQSYRIPFVVAGFEPLDLLQGLAMLVDLLEEGRVEVQNQYTRSVCREGNPHARAIVEEVFEVADMTWRGIGPIPKSGLCLRERYRTFDAEFRFEVATISREESSVCIAGEILQGKKKPVDCPAFGRECSPEHPLGAPMVSSEGACAAYYAFRRLQEAEA